VIKVLVCLHDKVLTDVVRTAFKQFPSMNAFPVPRSDVLELVREGGYDTLVLDIEERNANDLELLTRIREIDTTMPIMGLVDEGQKERLNKLKVEQNIFTLIALPLDPFELARRIHRLRETLVDTGSIG